MPRKPLIRNRDLCYHVTARSNNREWFYIPHADSWRIFTKKLAESADKYGAEIHTFVLMSNHFHLLVTTPNGNIDAFMRHFLSCSTKTIQLKAQRINHVFGARYRWSLIHSPVSLAYAYKYIVRNPVRAGICRGVEDYPWSTFNTLSNQIAISEGIGEYWKYIPKCDDAKKLWLNSTTSKEAEALVGRALRRYEFKFTTSSSYQKDLRILALTYGVESL